MIRRRYAGSEWLEKHPKMEGRPISELGKKVADLIGELERGIYHVDKEVTHKRVDWNGDRWIEVTLSDSNWATFDGCKLTHLIMLCHLFAIRCEVHAASKGYLRLFFSPRLSLDEKPDASFSEYHPTFEQHVDQFVKAYSH